ncbi:hypothetical protein D0962_10945 [Leptolyngbyaceae cyanobacterium CCMR0082]|uniref:Uncharacterized protein n=1 Tax=Adonisia turfae CCMR0082 TaxID=2304604 RepID=A0A6M0S4I3_9CYAN|nr:hypothetical protein [Adonisia turfae]NEZ63295.1 hypothetical protein [Adonisia turfae CCMR0082]
MTQSSKASPTNSAQSTLMLCLGWGIVSILFFLLFGALAPGEDSRPDWFLISISFLEIFAFLLAALLCFRNSGSSQIISGRTVWLWLGIGMLAYVAGNIFFFLWGTVWGLDPSVSLGDGFYFISYVAMVVGMLLAALPRRIDLTVSQWSMIFAIGAVGVVLACVLNYGLPFATAQLSPQPVMAAEIQLTQAPPESEPVVEPVEEAAEPVEEVVESEPNEVDEIVAGMVPAPGWAQALDATLEQFADPVALMYVVADCFLVVIAATLLVAFWGGRFSQSWRLIAIATFCLYIADMAFAAAGDNYIEGAWWETFWTLSALFFAAGAAIEYDVSKRSRRGSRRRA